MIFQNKKVSIHRQKYVAKDLKVRGERMIESKPYNFTAMNYEWVNFVIKVDQTERKSKM